jgi:RNA polymerase sigma factor (sigma-70 family)
MVRDPPHHPTYALFACRQEDISAMAVSGGPTREHEAFEQLYRLHARSVYGFARSRLGNADDAEDVTQTTFLNAYRACVHGRYPRHPESWLIAIASNECRQRFRQKQRRPREERLEEATVSVEEPNASWTAGDIQRALNALPALSRRALVMRELEGRSYAEIARQLELTDSALQSLLFRTRRQLREQFEATLTCAEARRALALRLKGELGVAGRRALRAHLRACPDCTEREHRAGGPGPAAQLLVVMLPIRRVLRLLGLSSGSSGTAAGTGGAVAGKAAAVLVAGALTGGAGYKIAEQPSRPAHALRTGLPSRVAIRPVDHRTVRHARAAVHYWASLTAPRRIAPRPAAAAERATGHETATEAEAAVAPRTTPEPAPPTASDPVPVPPSTPTPPGDSATPADPEPGAATDGGQASADPAPSDTVDGNPHADHPTTPSKGRPDPLPAATPHSRHLNGVSDQAEHPQPADAAAGSPTA